MYNFLVFVQPFGSLFSSREQTDKQTDKQTKRHPYNINIYWTRATPQPVDAYILAILKKTEDMLKSNVLAS